MRTNHTSRSIKTGTTADQALHLTGAAMLVSCGMRWCRPVPVVSLSLGCSRLGSHRGNSVQ